MTERSRWLTLAMVIFSVLALLAFAACGGGDDDDDGGDGSATPTRDGGDGGDDGGEDSPTDEPDGDGEEDPFAQLDELTEGLDQVTGKISYNITDEDGDVSNMTFYSKPPNSRFDSTDGTTTSIIITTPETTYICDTDSESCLATPGSGDDSSGLGLFGTFLSAEVIAGYVGIAEAAGVDVNQSSESINGIDASCFSWDDDSDEGIDQGKICFSEDAGVMVYQEFTGDSGTTKLEATDYSDDVPDSDFEPPYDVTEIPTP